MAQILKFPSKNLQTLTVRSGREHRASIEILDAVRPRRTRWMVQFEIQEVAGFAALKGFTDSAVAAGYRHRFGVGSTSGVRRFIAQTADLVAAGRVAVWVDGVRVRPRVVRRA